MSRSLLLLLPLVALADEGDNCSLTNRPPRKVLCRRPSRALAALTRHARAVLHSCVCGARTSWDGHGDGPSADTAPVSGARAYARAGDATRRLRHTDATGGVNGLQSAGFDVSGCGAAFRHATKCTRGTATASTKRATAATALVEAGLAKIGDRRSSFAVNADDK